MTRQRDPILTDRQPTTTPRSQRRPPLPSLHTNARVSHTRELTPTPSTNTRHAIKREPRRALFTRPIPSASSDTVLVLAASLHADLQTHRSAGKIERPFIMRRAEVEIITTTSSPATRRGTDCNPVRRYQSKSSDHVHYLDGTVALTAVNASTGDQSPQYVHAHAG